nr:hypothetical protein [Qipengyuania oceanensis]
MKILVISIAVVKGDVSVEAVCISFEVDAVLAIPTCDASYQFHPLIPLHSAAKHYHRSAVRRKSAIGSLADSPFLAQRQQGKSVTKWVESGRPLHTEREGNSPPNEEAIKRIDGDESEDGCEEATLRSYSIFESHHSSLTAAMNVCNWVVSGHSSYPDLSQSGPRHLHCSRDRYRSRRSSALSPQQEPELETPPHALAGFSYSSSGCQVLRSLKFVIHPSLLHDVICRDLGFEVLLNHETISGDWAFPKLVAAVCHPDKRTTVGL